MTPYEEFVASPARWFARRMALYTIVSLAVALIVVLGSGVYALLAG